MEKINFSPEELESVVYRIKEFFNKELDSEIGQFDAIALLEFFQKEIGEYHYNRGLRSALSVLDDRIESVKDEIYTLEEPMEFNK